MIFDTQLSTLRDLAGIANCLENNHRVPQTGGLRHRHLNRVLGGNNPRQPGILEPDVQAWFTPGPSEFTDPHGNSAP